MVASRARLPAAIRDFLEQRSALGALLEAPESSGLVLSRRNAALADRLLIDLYTMALRKAPLGWAPAALLAAVGGYGRRQLGWKSDLDVLFVTEGDPAELAGFVEAVLYPLWDAGIALGHQVTRVDDLIEDAQQSLPTATALLDFRALAGSVKLRDALRTRADAALFTAQAVPTFLARLAGAVDERWRRYGDSPYLLEPDVKNGAGGLRDVDVASWVAQANFPGASWPELVQAGVLTTHELQALQDATEFIFRVRNLLHENMQRRSDRLTFDQQELIAAHMGYGSGAAGQPDDSSASEVERTGRMVERFMSDYYRHAHEVSRAQERILARAFDRHAAPLSAAQPVRPGIVTQAGKLGFSDPEALEREPALALQLYSLACMRGEPAMPSARDLMSRLSADSPEFCAALRANAEAASLFLSLLCNVADAPFRNGSILAELHAVGLLVAMIPEFVPVIGRVHHDLYHVYTVDVHSVAAVDRVRALMRGELMSQHPRACRLAAETVQPQRLLLAALLHDVGKVFGGKEHSERGAQMAAAILQRFSLDAVDVEHVAKLIRLHLTMYVIAARRDLSDPSTIEQFAAQVGEVDFLSDLYVLTVADISTTAPTSMTTWKSRMLDELYGATADFLTGTTRSESLTRARSQLFAQTAGMIAPNMLEELLRSLPERYLLSNSPHEIAVHAQVLQAARGKRLHVQLVPSHHGIAKLCVVTGDASDRDGVGDRPGLLAALAAALTVCNIKIFAAQIYTRAGCAGQQGVFDLFWVRHPVEGIQGVQAELEQIERTLEDLLSGALTLTDVLKQRAQNRWGERPSPPVATEVSIDSTSSPKYTIIEVIAEDRPGLLFKLAHTLYEGGFSIVFAKVNTEGNRVIDIFYVTKPGESAALSRKAAEQLIVQLKHAVSWAPESAEG